MQKEIQKQYYILFPYNNEEEFILWTELKIFLMEELERRVSKDKDNNELFESEEALYNSRGREFINMIETTNMSKSYKIPVFLEFYNNGNVKMKIDEEDIYRRFYEFYHRGSNKVDMLRHKATDDFESWGKKEYVKIANDNPINFLIKTHGDFFKRSNDGLIGLYGDMSGIIGDRKFVEHMRDAVEVRVCRYYEERI